ncbi:hypothetical protein Dsin_008642 [Dipteronia sinensis]|uniref:Reverse transcriptase zinc-binding domain-containing protein n=1 Tax=Dipteronia sinensis TaxID=43782 RepID=A0AAE0EBC5_9ROSI|nr:hypothetical protein Dsin_008642 [Dipteronia sinensis]
MQRVVCVSDFRPINLCNVAYNIVTKALANRFRGVLGEVISESPNAFIAGRLIFDNAIIGFVCIHTIRNEKINEGSITLKIDLSKAYDRVEWSFLTRMTTVSSNVISGFKCSRLGPVVSHFFFADNNLFFSRASVSDCTRIQKILEDYSRASGQIINCNKSIICVSKSMPRSIGSNLASIIGVNLVECDERYLGLLNFSGRNKKQLFAYIKDRVWDKIKDRWIPRPSFAKVFSPPLLGVRAIVKALSSPSSGWNIPLIRASFLQEDVDAILSPPLSSFMHVDIVSWHYEKSGSYSVRCGYKVGRGLNPKVSTSGLSSVEAWWKFLWHMKIPNKIKIFMWKVCHHWIPTSFNLAKRGLPTDKFPKTTVHAL